MALWLLMLVAVSSANGEDACTTLVDSDTSASGDALLQKRQGLQQESVTLVGEDVIEKMSASEFLQGASFGYSVYQGSPKCIPQETSGLQGLQLLQRLRSLVQSVDSTNAAYVAQCEASDVGSTAPLDATGFKETTGLCCPVQMEAFFTRLLQLKGYSTCSTRHLQGLMHWFTCVPDMDFEYVLGIIQNGNPCKYWAPIGQACPNLSEECYGQWCDTTTTTTDQATTTPQPATTEKPATTETPTTTEAPTTTEVYTTTMAPTTTEVPTTTEAPTEAPSRPISGWWINKFKEDKLSDAIIATLRTGKGNGSNQWFTNGQPTGVGWGDYNGPCDSSKVFCAGGSLFGGHVLQARALEAAVGNGGKHPQAP